ncbi:hypothetical protein AQUCO_03300005v1 [Aquilegia coerulea]|uniref:Single-stranded DNA binding protein Ssb-like OB fold domain-containing protein n=1 Tax=Aquilegia coerulea TaxID=218851 RepID=A0A2G5CZ22_AQUCA|nr:hypothetical protein AQUCO_03300005v1 [Aquilegia coerulea]
MATTQNQTTSNTTDSSTGQTVKRKAVFIKVDELKPGTNGHNLTVKIVTCKTVLQKGRAASQHLRQTRIAECLVGDETGTIVFTARNEQVDMMKPGATVNLRCKDRHVQRFMSAVTNGVFVSN